MNRPQKVDNQYVKVWNIVYKWGRGLFLSSRYVQTVWQFFTRTNFKIGRYPIVIDRHTDTNKIKGYDINNFHNRI